MSEHEHDHPGSLEPNAFIRSEQEASADEAFRAATGTGAAAGALAASHEDALFEAHMRRFPAKRAAADTAR